MIVFNMNLSAQVRKLQCLALLAISPLLAHAQLSNSRIAGIQETFELNRDAFFQRNFTNPYPGLIPNADYQRFSWHHLNFAISALWLDRDLARANESIYQVAARGTQERIDNGEARFHWVAPILGRIYHLYGSNSQYFPGRLEPRVEKAVEEVLLEFIHDNSRVEFYTGDNIWNVWGTENHDAMKKTSLWTALRFLIEKEEYRNRTMGDGATVQEHFDSLNQFLIQRYRARLTRGHTIESMSGGYAKYTSQAWYNYYDFATDELRDVAKHTLDIWWAEWALQQIDGVPGGARSRIYQGPQNEQGFVDDTSSMAWFYLGTGRGMFAHPAFACLVTSSYRLPDVVVDLAMDIEGRGTYELYARKLGLYRDFENLDFVYEKIDDIEPFDSEYGGLLKYIYATPQFIMGSWMLEKRFAFQWVPMSSQNRWQGIIFRGHPDSRIFPQAAGLGNEKTYNQMWSVQRKGTSIVNHLSIPDFSWQAGDMRVWFSSDLDKSREGNWFFAEAEGAYAAVGVNPHARPQWESENWLRMGVSFFPIIFEVASKDEYPSMQAFKAAVLATQPQYRHYRLDYTGLSGDHFTFYYTGTRLPEINGEPIEIAIPEAYKSPFLNAKWGAGRNSDVISINKDGREKTITIDR